MKSKFYPHILIVIVMLLTLVSIKCIKWLQRTIFFDQFVYQKSLSYGYTKFRGIKDWPLAGKRGEDLFQLVQRHNSCLVKDGHFDNQFTIAIIGDSYVWGQGLTDEQRFVQILEKSLAKKANVSVISLGAQGDDLIANYAKYLLAEETLDIDLYVFGLVHNDIIINPYNHYLPEIISQINRDCGLPLFFLLPESTMNYEQQVVSSFSEKYGNSCVAKTIAGRLPKEGAVYFNYLESFSMYANLVNEYGAIFNNNGLEILSATDYTSFDEYQRKYKISKREDHPSYWANQVFAETLENYICTTYLGCSAK